MNYQEAEKYLDSLNNLGSVPGLDSIRELLHRFGNPQDNVKFIHIAGTNGKGSVGAFITEIIMNAGYDVGRYISPAVTSPLEIIQLNKHNIAEEEFADIVGKISCVCNEMCEDGLKHPTRFEVETAAAFMFFDRQKCDFAVVECGMGGLLDATNIISKVVCSVITPISVDHTAFLGETLGEIATHKAGIIKSNVPVVTAVREQEVLDIIEKTAMDKDSLCKKTGKVVNIRYNRSNIEFDYKEYKNLSIELLGVYQPQNAALAVECCLMLKSKGYSISDKDIYDGLRNTGWFGRFSKLGNLPDFIVDGAHNPDGAMELSKCLKEYYPNGNLTFIVGFFADKDYKSILDYCISYAGRIFTIETPNNPRALSSKALAEFIKNNYDVGVSSCENIEDAVKLALDSTDRNGAIVVFGSLSHLAMVSEAYRNLT